MHDIFLVGGDFDRKGGHASSIIRQLAPHLHDCAVLNGGHIDVLDALDFKKFKVLIWMPNIDNEEDKFLPGIKSAANPGLLLVSSKRIVEKSYTEADVVGRLLQSHSNLGIVVREVTIDLPREPNDPALNVPFESWRTSPPRTKEYEFQLMDPLGNTFARTTNIEMFGIALRHRIRDLRGMTRFPSHYAGASTEVPPIEDAFINVVRELGGRFTGFVNAVNPNRLLGNAATRCSRGFPAVLMGDRIFVSRRNVDKATLAKDDFVEVELKDGSIGFYGVSKPSVDSPIQLQLFKHYPNVKYIVHGHVYVEGAPKTAHKLPCGAVEEVEEIQAMFPDREHSNFAVNLWGHGCLLLAKDLEFLRSANLVGRPFPEE